MMFMTEEAASSVKEQLSYELLTTHIDDFEQMSYTTYGVRVTSGGAKVFECTDISTAPGYVKKFIDIVKDRDVSAIHIADVLEDYLD